MSSHLTAHPSRPIPLSEARALRELRAATRGLLDLCEGEMSLAYYSWPEGDVCVCCECVRPEHDADCRYDAAKRRIEEQRR